MARKDSEHQKKSMSLLFRGKAIFKPLNIGHIDEHVSCVREWIANIFFYTKNGTTIMIDAGYNYARLQEKMGWLDLDPASIRHRTEICKPFTKKYTDPSAPYDGYIEDDDTEKHARSVLLGKVAVNRQ